jgi:hypothetical protein
LTGLEHAALRGATIVSASLSVVSKNSEQPPTASPHPPFSRRYLRALRLQYRRKHSIFDPHALNCWLRQVRDHHLNPTDTSHPGPLMRAVHVPIPMRVRMNHTNRLILQRAMRIPDFRPRIPPISVVRSHYRSDAPLLATFKSRGPRYLFSRPGVRQVAILDTETSWRSKKRAEIRAARAARTWG